MSAAPSTDMQLVVMAVTPTPSAPWSWVLRVSDLKAKAMFDGLSPSVKEQFTSQTPLGNPFAPRSPPAPTYVDIPLYVRNPWPAGLEEWTHPQEVAALLMMVYAVRAGLIHRGYTPCSFCADPPPRSTPKFWHCIAIMPVANGSCADCWFSRAPAGRCDLREFSFLVFEYMT